VIVAVIVVSVKLPEEIDVDVFVKPWTTCKTLPPPLAGVAHFKPVASALSATKSAILQEQSQRIVLGA
jgi:hypothetical protein